MRLIQKGTIIVAIWSLIFTMIMQPVLIFAKELNHLGVIDAIHLSKNQLNDGEHVKFTVDFSEKQGVDIEEGDTITLNLPSSNKGYIHGFEKSFDLKDENNRVLGRVNVQEGRVVITFNREAATLDNVRGNFYFTAEARNIEETNAGSTVTLESNFGVSNLKKETITITRGPTVGGDYPPYYKVGGMYTNDTNHVKWWLNFNLNRHTMQEDAYIEDKVMPGHEMDWDTFKVLVNNQSPGLSKEEFEKQGYGKIDLIDGNPDHFYIQINKEKTQNASLTFEYKTTITEQDQDSFENQSKVWYNFGNGEKANAEESNDIVANIFAGGGAEGDLSKKEVNFSKVDTQTNKPLSGATLQVYDTTDNKEIATFTSTASLKSLTLAKGHYYELREVTAPTGYKLSDPITFRVTAYGLVETKQVDGSYKKVDDFTVVMHDEPETKSIDVLKVGSDQLKEGLAGARLTLKDLTTNKVIQTVTTTKEKLSLPVTYGHIYELSEESAPEGYDIAQAIVFQIKKDGTVMVKEKDAYIPLRGNVLTMVDHKKAPEKTNVYVKKLAQDEIVPVVGATLKIIDAETKEDIMTWTSGTTPKKLSLENGKSYILNEVKAPEGYLLAKDIAFSITEDGKVMIDGKEVTNATLTMIDVRKEVTKKVLKVNEEGKALRGVTFLLRNRSTHLIEKEFTTTTEPTEVNLKVGHVYDLIEKMPLPGYEAIDPIILLVKKDGTIMIDGQVVHDDIINIKNIRLKKDVSFAKRDDETKALLQGATLKITNLATTETIEWQTAKDITKHTLKYGCHYRLEEVKVPNGYQAIAPVDFVIRDDGRVQVKKDDTYINISDDTIELFDKRKQKDVAFEKKDAQTKAFVSGAKLQLHDLTNDEMIDWTSTSEDKTLKLTYGHRYELIETEAPEGYTRAKSLMIEVTMTGDILVDGQLTEKVTLYNDRKTVTVPFKKVDEFGNLVQGAMIELTNKATGEVNTIKNSEETLALTYGTTYVLEEIKVPAGYEKAEPLTVEVTMAGKIMVNGKEVTDAIEMVDTHQTKQLFIEKRDDQSKLFLQGASFTLVDTTTGNEDRWISTMEKKQLNLTYGHRYELKEIQAPNGYRLVQPILIEVKMDGKVYIDGELYTSDTYVIYNRRLDAPLQFKKIDESGKVLTGAKMTLYNISAHQSLSFETGTQPIELSLERRQVYRLEENEAPVGYQIADPMVIMITDTGKVLVNNKEYPYDTIEMVDLSLKKEVLIEKRDASTQLPLAHAKLAVEDEDGHLLAEWTSTKEAHALELVYGKTYVLKEIEAPKGYEKAEPLRFKLDHDGVIYVEKNEQWKKYDSVTLYNRRQTKEVPFKKIDELNKLVHGATITVKNITTGEMYELNTSEETLALTYGTTYVLEEIKVPAGYEKAEPLTVEVTMAGKIMVNGKEVTDTIEMVDLHQTKEVVVSKQDKQTQQRLEGATLAIRDLNTKEVVAQWISSSKTNKTLHLPWGHCYALEELKAPKYYERLSKPMEFTVTQEGQLMMNGQKKATLIVNNQRKEHGVLIHKYMTNTTQPVKGATLVLSHDNEYNSFITKETGEEVILKEGVTYHLSEKDVPTGFEKAKSLTLVINDEGKLVVNGQVQSDYHVRVEDTPLVYVAKRNAVTKSLLPKAKMRVINKQTRKTVFTFETNDQLTPLPVLEPNVEYQLIEDNAPVGYHLAKPITFKLSSQWDVFIANGNTWEKQSERLITMYDEPYKELSIPDDKKDSTSGEGIHALDDIQFSLSKPLPLNQGVPYEMYQTKHKGKLPTTGNKMNYDMMVFGILLVGISLAGMTYYRVRRK